MCIRITARLQKNYSTTKFSKTMAMPPNITFSNKDSAPTHSLCVHTSMAEQEIVHACRVPICLQYAHMG